ncbi:Rep family protein [Staphylococcus aureus]
MERPLHDKVETRDVEIKNAHRHVLFMFSSNKSSTQILVIICQLN